MQNERTPLLNTALLIFTGVHYYGYILQLISFVNQCSRSSFLGKLLLLWQIINTKLTLLWTLSVIFVFFHDKNFKTYITEIICTLSQISLFRKKLKTSLCKTIPALAFGLVPTPAMSLA